MRKSRFSEEQIIGLLKEAEAGRRVADVCREHGVAEATFYRWKVEVNRHGRKGRQQSCVEPDPTAAISALGEALTASLAAPGELTN